MPGLSAATAEGGGLTLEAVPHPSGPVALHAVGDVDLATAPFLAEQVGDWLAASPRIVLDLSGVGVFPRPGSRCCSTASTTPSRPGWCWAVLRRGRQVRRVLQGTGTCEHLRVLDPHPPSETPDGRAPLFPVPD